MVLKTQALLGDTVLQEWLKLPACAQCWDHEDMGGHGRNCFKHKLCLAVCRMAAMLGPCMGVLENVAFYSLSLSFVAYVGSGSPILVVNMVSLSSGESFWGDCF